MTPLQMLLVGLQFVFVGLSMLGGLVLVFLLAIFWFRTLRDVFTGTGDLTSEKAARRIKSRRIKRRFAGLRRSRLGTFAGLSLGIGIPGGIINTVLLSIFVEGAV